MANPFLMMDDDVGDGADSTINPFLMQDGEGGEENEFDNPFAGQATNPFAFGDEPDDVPDESTADVTTNAQIFDTNQAPITTTANKFQSIDAAMSFFGTTIEADDDPISVDIKPSLNNNQLIDDSSTVYSSEDELTKRTGPPPRPTPPSKTTQDLIYSVADHLDQASSQLLGRLPATRSPSPVSMRDLNSPCPTPDSAMVDFFDVSDSGPSSGQGFEMDLMNSGPVITDNPFAPTSIPNMQATSPIPPTNKTNQPNRPPRPAPPRPVPPSVPSAPVRPSPPKAISAQQPTEPDLFDMFGTSAPPKPPPPKTTQDIMSLFQAPKPVEQPTQDLFGSDNILDAIPNEDTSLPPPFTENITAPQQAPSQPEVIQMVEPDLVPKVVDPIETVEEESAHVQSTTESLVTVTDPIFTSVLTEPEEQQTEETSSPIEVKSAIVDEHPPINKIIPVTNIRRAPTPDIEITTVEDLPRSDDEEEVVVPPPRPPPPQRSEPEETEVDINAHVDVDSEKAESDITSPPSDSVAHTNAMDVSPMDLNNSSFQISEPEQMDTGLDFAPASGVSSANPFASPDDDGDTYLPPSSVTNIFASPGSISDIPTTVTNIFADPVPVVTTNIFAADDMPAAEPTIDVNNVFGQSDEFDAFSAKFDSVKKDNVSLLEGFGGTTPTSVGGDAWGSDAFGNESVAPEDGFGAEDDDPFLSMPPALIQRSESVESVDKEFSVVIRPKAEGAQGFAPILAPPPPPPRGSQNNSIYSGDSSPRVNPFDKSDDVTATEGFPTVPDSTTIQRTDSQESPQTPLFDDDVSQPLEDFPRINYVGDGWEMQLRQPNKKKITGQRFWKKIHVKMMVQGDVPAVQLFNQPTDKQPFQELPLQPSYSVSEIGSQQYDQFGKIFTMKLQYIFYKERPGVRPGQVTKAERITNKLSQFAAYAIQGDYQGVKEFGSDLKKLGLPVEHAPQSSQLFKIGTMTYEDLKQFSVCIEESLFKLSAHRDRALNYKMEEVQVTAVDEIYVEQDAEGIILKQIARVRLFFLAFLTGMPTIELGLNDMWRQGKEVVGRHDIIPVVTEEWIRLEGVEFHNTVSQEEYERSRTIRFQPPDACYIELMRFRVRPPKNRELPLQLKASWCVTGNRVELRADILVPGFASRKLGQIPCEDVSVRFPIPECWIYLFRVEKHFRYGSVKSAHRRTGKIKGIERILGAVDTLQESLIEVTSGQAKYEHNHRAIVWRCPRLPKEGQGAYTTHQMVCRMALTSYDQIPDQLAPFAYVEFTMPATQVSHTTVRSISVQDSDSDDPPEKYVRYLARHEYRVGIETTHGETTNAYLAATRPIKEEARAKPAALSPMPPSDSDTDSN